MSATNNQSAKFFYGWYIAAASLLIYFFTNGMSIFVPQNLFPRFMETFSATEGEVSLTVALMFGLTAILAPFAGALIDRYGPLRIIRVGICIMAVCFLTYPFAQSLQQLYLLHVGLALGLVLGGLLVNVVLLSNWFVRYRGFVIGLLTAMSSLGGFVLPNAISPLVNAPDYGWRWGVGALAVAFCLLVLLPGFTVLREKPADVGQQPDGAPEPVDTDEDAPQDGVTFGVALRSRTLWALALGSACLWFTFQAINSQATLFFELDVGLEPQEATRLYTWILGWSIAGKFLFGALSDRYSKRAVIRFTSFVLLIGCVFLFTVGDTGIGLTTSTAQLTLFTIIFGLGYGGSFTLIQLVSVESFGQRALGKILGLVICIDSIGGMLGTYVTGQLKTVTGSYFISFSLVAGIAVVGLACVMLVKPVRQPAA